MYVALLCSSSDGIESTEKGSSEAVIEALAATDYSFVLGGASTGLMRQAYEKFEKAGHEMVIMQTYNRRDESILIDPSMIVTQKDHFRRTKSIMDLSDVFVFLPGGIGTHEELFSLLSNKLETGEEKPILIYNETGTYTPLLIYINTLIDKQYIIGDKASFYKEVKDINTLLKELNIVKDKKNRKER